MRQAIALGVSVAVSVATAWADTVRVTDDTNINLATPNQNNGTNGSLFVRNVGSGGVRHGFLRFDLADLDPSRPIAYATLKLWVATVENAGLVSVHPVLDPWNEATLTAGTVPQPGLGIAVESFALSAADGKHFVSVDVTALVRDWLDGTLANHGIALLPSVVDNVRAELNGKENTSAGSAPEIEVLSAADVTSVQTGTGLEGGGSSGDLVVQLKNCVLGGEVLKWDGAGWGCAIDSVGGGVTNVGSGQGLIGGPITTSGTLSLDTGFTDSRYSLFGHSHDASYIFKSGDTMTGALNLPANGLVAGTNQLVLSGGKVGIGTLSPSGLFHTQDNTLSFDFGGTPSFTRLGFVLDALSVDNGHQAAIRAFFTDTSLNPAEEGGRISFPLSDSRVPTEAMGIGFWTRTGGGAVTERVRIDQDGQMGIGTMMPSQKLEVAGNLRISGGGNGLIFPDNTVQMTAASGGGGSVTSVGSGLGLTGGPITTSGTLSLDTGFTDSRYSLFGHSHDASYIFKSGDTMTGTLNLPANGLAAGGDQLVLSGGKVGIGTLSPSGLFHTQDNTLSFDFGGTPSFTRLGFVLDALSVDNGHQAAIRAFFTDTSLNPAEEGGRISFPLSDSRVPTEAMGIGFWTRTGGGAVTERVRIDQDGQMGIGTMMPSQKLEVAGNLRISGGGNGLIFPDDTVQMTAASGGGGSVTSVGSGLGLTGGPITTSGTLSLDTGFTDSRYSLFGHSHDASYIFKSGDTMTGTLNLPANGLLAGTDQLVLSGGNVGIGTSPSNYRLHVKATAGPSQHLMAIQGGATGFVNSGGIAFLDADGTSMGSIGDGSQGNSHIYLGAELGNLILYTGSTNSLVIDSSHRVGIGTDLPTVRLDVAGDVRSSAQLISTVGSGTPPLSVASSTNVPNLNADLLDGLDSTAFASAGSLGAFVAKSGDTMTGTLNLPANGLAAGTDQLVLSGGNVGVGSSSPSQKLEVAGNVQISGSGNGLKFPDGTTQSTAAAAPMSRTPAQIALLRWYDGLQSGADFPVGGNNPQGIAFDGSHVWIANQVSGNITKLRASDGALIATYAIGGGSAPHDVAFDGANIWVTNHGASGITKLRASDGTVLGTFSVGSTPIGIAFDGTNVWATSFSGGIVRKIRASDGADQGSFATGTQPWGVAFDGANIWVTNNGSANVTKLRASDGANLGSFAVGPNPHGVAFDGANIWVANESSGNSALSSVTKLRASDGANLASIAVGSFPYALAFDGTHIWVAASGGVTKLRASSGASLGTFPAGGTRGVAFDGANIWVTNFFGHTVSKR